MWLKLSRIQFLSCSCRGVPRPGIGFSLRQEVPPGLSSHLYCLFHNDLASVSLVPARSGGRNSRSVVWLSCLSCTLRRPLCAVCACSAVATNHKRLQIAHQQLQQGQLQQTRCIVTGALVGHSRPEDKWFPLACSPSNEHQLPSCNLT